eukprot:GHVU01215460.1.p1 GENE.GHVU01215460.1~~GHVU01215460.1.p1  ORF type:complete len:153 (-),score=13.91 GHVU01215460.1:928-1386(-)
MRKDVCVTRVCTAFVPLTPLFIHLAHARLGCYTCVKAPPSLIGPPPSIPLRLPPLVFSRPSLAPSPSFIPSVSLPHSPLSPSASPEGTQIFNEKWAQIAKHVQTRTPEECVAHFLTLPIEAARHSTRIVGCCSSYVYCYYCLVRAPDRSAGS